MDKHDPKYSDRSRRPRKPHSGPRPSKPPGQDCVIQVDADPVNADWIKHVHLKRTGGKETCAGPVHPPARPRRRK